METNGSEIRFEGCGDIIRTIRQDADLTLRELAEQVGCSHGNLGKIENNQLALTLTMIEQIANAMGSQPEKIVLKCLEGRFPRLRESKAGSIVAAYLSKTE